MLCHFLSHVSDNALDDGKGNTDLPGIIAKDMSHGMEILDADCLPIFKLLDRFDIQSFEETLDPIGDQGRILEIHLCMQRKDVFTFPRQTPQIMFQCGKNRDCQIRLRFAAFAEDHPRCP